MALGPELLGVGRPIVGVVMDGPEVGDDHHVLADFEAHELGVALDAVEVGGRYRVPQSDPCFCVFDYIN